MNINKLFGMIFFVGICIVIFFMKLVEMIKNSIFIDIVKSPITLSIVFLFITYIFIRKYIDNKKRQCEIRKKQEEYIKNKKDNIRNEIYEYIHKNNEEIIQEYISSGKKNFLIFLSDMLKEKDFDISYFDDVYKEEANNLISLFMNKEFIIKSKINIEDITNINKINIINEKYNYKKNIIENNCLIRPLYFSNIYTYEDFKNKHSLFLIYEKIIKDAYLQYDRMFYNDIEKSKNISLIISEEMNSFSHYLKTFIEVMKLENFRDRNYFLIPYNNVYIDIQYYYKISNIPFNDDEESLYIDKINKDIKRCEEEKRINYYNSLIDGVNKEKYRIQSIIKEYNMGLNVINYYSLIMDYFLIPYWSLDEYNFNVSYSEENNILCIDIKLPSECNAPKIIDIKNILKRTGEVRYKYYTDKQFKDAYNNFIYQYVLAVIYFIFLFR